VHVPNALILDDVQAGFLYFRVFGYDLGVELDACAVDLLRDCWHRQQQLASVVQLYKALGGGWPVQAEVETEADAD
jgi:hypothetical protein